MILALVAKYELGGMQEMTDPQVFGVSHLREMGEMWGVTRRFGNDPNRLRETLVELQRRPYAA